MKEIRDYLRENRVYIRKEARKPIADSLLRAIHEPTPSKWPTNETTDPTNDPTDNTTLALPLLPTAPVQAIQPLNTLSTPAPSAQSLSAEAPPAQALSAQAPLASPLPPTAEPPLPMNVTAVSNDLPTAKLPSPTNVTAPPTNVTAPPTYNPDTACYLPRRSATSKITSIARPKRLQPTDKRLCRYACNPSNASTVLLHTIDKLIAPLCLLLRHRLRQYVYNLPIK